MGEYLWDKTGRDEEVERLEKLLEPFALKARSAPIGRRRRVLIPLFVGTMAAAVLVTVLWLAAPQEAPSGEPRTIDFGAVGRVTLEPYARVRIVKRSDELIKLRLELGTLHASIAADVRPRLFQVETPAATCVDLGCRYMLTVDEGGRSVVRVQTGRVAFVDEAREVYIPAGASCRATRERGSGTPVWDDASAELVESVRRFEDAGGAGRVAAARQVAARAERAKDALTLWHFLQDSNDEVVAIGVDALVKLVGLPEGATREASLRRDPQTLQAWKDHLAWW